MGRPEELDLGVKEPLLPAGTQLPECDRVATRQEHQRRRRRILIWTGLALCAWTGWNLGDSNIIIDEIPALACPSSEFAWDSVCLACTKTHCTWRSFLFHRSFRPKLLNGRAATRLLLSVLVSKYAANKP